MKDNARTPKPTAWTRLTGLLKTPRARDFFIILAAGFVLATVITLPSNPHRPEGFGGDNTYYYKNAMLFQNAWKEPLHYFFGLLFNTLPAQELAAIGYNHMSDIDSFQRAPTYMAYLSLWTLIFGDSGISLLASQTILIGLIFSLLYLFLGLFVPRPLAFAGPILAAFYIFFYMDAAVTLTEIFMGVCILLVLYLLHTTLRIPRPSKRRIVLLAFAIALLVFNKTAMKFIFLLILPLAVYLEYWARKSDRKTAFRNSAILVVAYIIIHLTASGMLSRGEHPASANTLGWRNFYAGACIQNDGFTMTGTFHNEEFRRNLPKGKDQFWFNRYSEVCKYATMDIIRSEPLRYAMMTLKKISVQMTMGAFNYDSFLSRFSRAANAYHLVIIALFILSFFVIRTEPYAAFKGFTLVVLGYHSAIYGLSNPDPRYFLPMVPLYITGIVFLANEIMERKLHTDRRTYAVLVILATLLVLWNKEILLGLGRSTAFVMLARTLLLAAASAAIYLITRPRMKDPMVGIFPVMALVCIIMMLLPVIFDDRGLSRQEVRSASFQQTIVTDHADPPKVALIAVNIRALKPGAAFSVSVNGTKLSDQKVSDCRISLSTNYYSRDDIPPQIPQWIYIPVPGRLITRSNVISLSGSDIAIMKVYPEKNPKFPSFFNLKGCQGVYGPGNIRDNRAMLDMKPLASIRSSSVMDRKILQDLDIYLLLRKPGGYTIQSGYAQFMEQNPKFIALYNPLDQKIAVWTGSDIPVKGYEPVTGNLYRYLAGELDRFDPGYTIY